jgi:hypothetical protein
MEKAESFSFPKVPGSGGRGQSLHNQILVGAKRLNCHSPIFLLSFVIGFSIYIPTHSYHTLRRIYSNPTSHHQKNTPEPGRCDENHTKWVSWGSSADVKRTTVGAVRAGRGVMSDLSRQLTR